MRDNKLWKVSDFIWKHCKIVFPVIVVAVVAFTVTLALNWNRERDQAEGGDAENSTISGGDEQLVQMTAAEDIPMVQNEDNGIQNLVMTYYNAMATGDTDTLRTLYDVIPENDLLRDAETAKYLDHYAEIQIFTKPGPLTNSVIAFVYYRVCFVDYEEEFPGYENLYICRDEQGQPYIKNEVNFSEEEITYITAVLSQADVAEFNNRVNVEYNNLVTEKPELLEYLAEVGEQVKASVGVSLAEQNVNTGETGQEGNAGEDGQEDSDPVQPPEPAAETTPAYATATTTVNVRRSDSEQADRLGRVTGGTRVQVQEVLVNGWTKVIYEGSDGYIKSDYLQFAESVAGQEAIGRVTATTNVKIRSAASVTSDQLGVLAGGESLDLLAVEGEWCKVIYNGQTGYVKAEFVERQ